MYPKRLGNKHQFLHLERYNRVSRGATATHLGQDIVVLIHEEKGPMGEKLPKSIFQPTHTFSYTVILISDYSLSFFRLRLMRYLTHLIHLLGIIPNSKINKKSTIQFIAKTQILVFFQYVQCLTVQIIL